MYLHFVQSLPIKLSLGLLFLVSSAFAQVGVNFTGTGGKSTIQGKVYYPSGMTVDSQVRVSLESTTFTALSVMTDNNGAFGFRNLSPGTYTVVVNVGDRFQVTRETITIDPDVVGVTRTSNAQKSFTLPIYLQLKGEENAKARILNAKLAQFPKAAIKLFEKGVALQQTGKFQEAIVEYKAALVLAPDFGLALIGIGINSIHLNKLDDAIDNLSQGLKFEPESFDAKLHLGIALLNKKRLDEAEKYLSDAATTNVSAVTPHFYLAMIAMQRKDLDKAQSQLETAKKLKPESEFPLVHRYLGGIYWEKKMYHEAVTELESYLKLAPDARDADRIRATIKDLKSKA